MDFVVGMRAAGAALPGICPHLPALLLVPPARDTRWVGREEELWVLRPKIQPVPPLSPLWQRWVPGETLWRCGERFGDPPPWGSLTHQHPLVSPGPFQAGGSSAGAACLRPGDAAGFGGDILSPKLSPLTNLLCGALEGGQGAWPSQPAPGTSWCVHARLGRGWIRPQLVPDPPPPPAGTFLGVATAGATIPLPPCFVFPNPGCRNNLLIKCINS